MVLHIGVSYARHKCVKQPPPREGFNFLQCSRTVANNQKLGRTGNEASNGMWVHHMIVHTVCDLGMCASGLGMRLQPITKYMEKAPFGVSSVVTWIKDTGFSVDISPSLIQHEHTGCELKLLKVPSSKSLSHSRLNLLLFGSYEIKGLHTAIITYNYWPSQGTCQPTPVSLVKLPRPKHKTKKIWSENKLKHESNRAY